MNPWLRNALIYAAVGSVLFVPSERIFWSVFRAHDALHDLAITWLAYTAVSVLVVRIVARFRVVTADRMLLVGALYGWLIEGTLVGTLYGTEASAPFPMSIVWTGLSWHALISVGVCWFALDRALRAPTALPALAVAAGLGVYWGAWATFLWRETPPERVSVTGFALHALGCTALFIAGHAVLQRLPATTVRPGWFGPLLSLAGLAVFYSAQVRALGLRPLVMLPALCGAILWLLWRSRPTAEADPAPESPSAASPVRLLTLGVMPLTATALYAVQRAMEVPGIPPIQFYRVEAVLSVGLMLWAIWKAWTPARSGR